MSRQFVSFAAQMPIVEAAVELVKNELLGGPVVDEGGHLVGWISEQDCIGAVSQVVYYEDRVAMVEDVMSKDISFSEADRNALDLAEDMKNHKRKIYPVVDENKMVLGVVSRRHILREMLERITHPDAPNAQ